LREYPLATHAFVEAVRCGDIVAVRALLAAAPELVPAARKMTGESIVRRAVFRRPPDAPSPARKTTKRQQVRLSLRCSRRMLGYLEGAAGVERTAPLIYVSPRQINFEVPAGTALGTATVTIASNATTLQANAAVQAVAPTLFSANSSGSGVAAG